MVYHRTLSLSHVLHNHTMLLKTTLCSQLYFNYFCVCFIRFSFFFIRTFPFFAFSFLEKHDIYIAKFSLEKRVLPFFCSAVLLCPSKFRFSFSDHCQFHVGLFVLFKVSKCLVPNSRLQIFLISADPHLNTRKSCPRRRRLGGFGG